MRIVELVRLAISRLSASKLRAALTMLGVVIGVASVVALVAVGEGATSGVTSRIQSLGTNLLTISPGSATSRFTRGAAGSANTLTTEDAAVLGRLDGVAAAEPEITTQQFVASGAQNTTTSIVGTTPDYVTVRAYGVWQGSFLTGASVDHALQVAVLGATTADNLGLTAADVGSRITIAGLPFEVIGILQPKGSSGATSQDDQVLVPITTLQDHFVGTGSDRVRAIGISVASQSQMEQVKALVTTTLEGRHGVTSANDDFTITDQSQLISTFSSITATLTMLLAGIASISLLVGGIGIMNIMLVSVRERTREIGIRKAIGAHASHILLQFLVEALVLSLLGGFIGIAIGLLVSMGIGQVAGWGFVFNPLTVFVAVLFSVAVGVVFGVLPARQAARLDPVEALRFE